MLNQEQVLQRLEAGQPIQGMHVGRLDLQARTIGHPVVFEEVLFTDRVTFTGCQFSQAARFFDCRFQTSVDFDRCSFVGPAYFWRSRFEGDATFLDSTIQPQSPEGIKGSVNPGEANFSWVTFCGRACFYRTHFFGPAYFWRTVFRGPAMFGEAKFDAATLFAGSMYDVCLSKRDWGEELFDDFLRRGVLSPDHERVDVFRDNRVSYYYGQITGVSSEQQLRDRLHERQFAVEVSEGVVKFWRDHARPMFTAGENAGGDFSNAHFGRPEAVHFREVNLGECLFAHCDLTGVNFAGVTWDTRDTRPVSFRSTRRAVRDERNVPSTGQYTAISRLYRQLRKNYESQEQYEEAGDFHIGEMEMKRLERPAPWRYVSLLAFYGWLSGYGQQSTVALAWLLVFVLLLFPGLYLLTGVTTGVMNAVLHSLEVCTFLKSNNDVPLPLPGRFVDGFERILVGLQAGLFLVTIKRRFGRN